MGFRSEVLTPPLAGAGIGFGAGFGVAVGFAFDLAGVGFAAFAAGLAAVVLPGTWRVWPTFTRSGWVMPLARARASTLTPRRRATPPRVSPRRSVYRVAAAEEASSRSTRRTRRVRDRRMTNEKAPSPRWIGTLQQPLQSQQEQFQQRHARFLARWARQRDRTGQKTEKRRAASGWSGGRRPGVRRPAARASRARSRRGRRTASARPPPCGRPARRSAGASRGPPCGTRGAPGGRSATR